MPSTAQPFADILRAHGLRVTHQRLAMLAALSRLDRPVPVSELAQKVKDIDPVTLYRSLESMKEVGIVRTVEVRKAYLHYELVATKKHHHHATCVSCGYMEDVSVCLPKGLEAQVLGSASRFRSITGHTLEFVGLCRACQHASPTHS